MGRCVGVDGLVSRLRLVGQLPVLVVMYTCVRGEVVFAHKLAVAELACRRHQTTGARTLKSACTP